MALHFRSSRLHCSKLWPALMMPETSGFRVFRLSHKIHIAHSCSLDKRRSRPLNSTRAGAYMPTPRAVRPQARSPTPMLRVLCSNSAFWPLHSSSKHRRAPFHRYHTVVAESWPNACCELVLDRKVDLIYCSWMLKVCSSKPAVAH